MPGLMRRPRFAQRVDRGERQRLAEHGGRLDEEFLQAVAHGRAAALGEIELLDRLRPELEAAAVGLHHDRAGAVRRHRAEIVGHQREAALRQSGGQRRFARARGAAEQHGLAVHAHGAGVQHHLPALMQQDAEHGAGQENRDVGGRDAGGRFEHDLAPAREQEARHVGNAKQETIAGDLPGRAARARLRQGFRHRARPHHDVGRLSAGGAAAMAPGSSISLATPSPATR